MHYRNVFVVGLSQGGFASLFAAIAAQPTAAVVASGYSVLFEELFYGALNQPIAPDLRKFYGKDQILKSITKGKTRYLFSWEESENLIYGYESESLESFRILEKTGKAEYYNKNRGHTFPPGVVLTSFYKKMKAD
jgi:hypothetical protein